MNKNNTMGKITSHQTPKMKIDDKIYPDDELLAFAKSFSENYLSNEIGDYFSDNGNYTIEYKSNLPINQKGFICIGMETGIIHINKEIVNSFYQNDKDFIFLMIIWNVVIYTIGLGKYSESDKLTVQYFIDNDLLFPNLLDCFIRLTKHNMTKQNLDRIHFLKIQLANTLNNKK